MTGSRTGAADLTLRLNKGNIQDIFTRITDGDSCKFIADLYNISYSSLVRIVSMWNWTPAQCHHWDIENLTRPVWPEETKRPKNSYPPEEREPEPIIKTVSKKVQPSDGHKSTEYEAGGDDANRYRDDNGADDDDATVVVLSDPLGLLPETTAEIGLEEGARDLTTHEPHASTERDEFLEHFPEHITIEHSLAELEDSPAQKYFDEIPRLQDLMPQIEPDPRIEEARAKIRTHRKVSQEIVVAFNNVEAAWLLLTEEINELKNILNI
jgi:hypothetical protein